MSSTNKQIQNTPLLLLIVGYRAFCFTVLKRRTKPFTSEKNANSFSKLVNGKVTEQLVGYSKKVFHVHYKSDGVYKGKKKDVELNFDFEGYTHDARDI